MTAQEFEFAVDPLRRTSRRWRRSHRHPAELNFTDTVKKYFSWVPKSGSSGMFDCLPLVLQIDPKQPPSIFELPEECLLEVPIHHPNVPEISSLGLKWYGIPAVSNITLRPRGLHYTRCTVQRLVHGDGDCDSKFRRREPVQLASKDCRSDGNRLFLHGGDSVARSRLGCSQLCRVVISSPVTHASIVDHHTAAASFVQWHAEELKNRGYCPGNWKWIIPPTASSTSSIYLGLKLHD